MSRPTKDEHHAAKHAFFRADFDAIQNAVRDVRIQCLSDRRFCYVPGAQWEGAVGEQFENKPRFEFNKTHLAVLRVINEYRNNRITADFVPKDGSEADELADNCDGLFRADEQDSGAQEAYDNTFEEGTSGGMGAIRVRARYEDEDDDEDDRQRMSIEPIYEADTCVFFDLGAKRYDKSDAKRCYVLTAMSPADYEDEYGHSPASWPKDISQSCFDWATPDVVWVAEVYEVEQKSELVHFFRGIALNDDEPNELRLTDEELAEPGKLDELTATGFREARQKRIKRTRVRKWLMDGAQILDDCGYIAGTCIPIIPFYGKRVYVDGIERIQGHVRLARDAQVLDNMIKSWLAEMAARFDVEKPIFTPEQIAGHAQTWADDAIKKYPFLLANSMLDVNGTPIPGSAAPVGYTRAPNLQPAMAALAQLAATSLEDMLGNQQAGEQMQPNQSGFAIELIQQRLDMQTFIYVDNFGKTVKRVGAVWLAMAKDLLVEPGRKMKTLDQSGKPGMIELLKPMIDKETGAKYLANDLSGAKFDVNVEVGPSSASRRAATVRSMLNMAQMTDDPETKLMLIHTAMMNAEGEGMEDTRAWARRKLVRMGAIKPTEDEAKELQAEQANQGPDANTEFLQASAKKALADAAQSQARTELTAAQVGQVRADTIQKLASVEQGREAHAVGLAIQIGEHGIEQQQAAAAAAPEIPAQPGMPGAAQ